MIIGIGLGASFPNTGGGAAAWADSPAPPGFHWEFVTSNGAAVTSSGNPVVALARN